mmetsp:Transcript_41652/g.98758  ORF Transcript_41652/g.98758 Transcript_41652/m.98758 type:complete len:480 (+) Transcript_41652:201-1640(+)
MGQDRRGESAWSSVFTLANTAIGVGVLSFPFAYRLTGLLGGCFLCALVAFLEQHTLRTLVRAASYYGVFSYQAVVQRAFGPVPGKVAATILSICMVIYLYGSLVAYLILVGDVSKSLAVWVVGPDSFWSRRWVDVTLPGVVICLPLCLTRSLGALSAVSSLAVVALAYTTAVIVTMSLGEIKNNPQVLHEAELIRISSDSIHALPMMVFAFQCHTTVVQIFTELEDQPSLGRWSALRKGGGGAAAAEADDAGEAGAASPAPGTSDLRAPLIPSARGSRRKLRGMYSVITMAVIECLLGYSLVGVFGYLSHPTSVESNVLNSMPANSPPLQVARLLMGVNGIVSYPVNLFPCRQAVEHLMASLCGFPPAVEATRLRHATTTILLFAASLAAALLVTDLGSVFQAVGGTAGAVMIFILPGLIWMQLEAAAVGPCAEAPEGAEGPGASRKGALARALRMAPGVLVVTFGAMLLTSTALDQIL